MTEQTSVTMDDVFVYLESQRLPAEQEAKWLVDAIEDLRKGDPTKALDILDGASTEYTYELWVRDEEKIRRARTLLEFLEEQFWKKGVYPQF